ncbi:MAG TPA: methyl-accepting chemotaxis protein, partial [Calditrichia bacterium]|nr:methyl-accepting chemotaxis protein [Calditrichia bacterium]
FLTALDGQIIQRDKDTPARRIDREAVDHAGNRGLGLYEFSDEGGQPYIGIYSHNADDNWLLGIEIAQDEVFHSQKALLNNFWVMLLAGGIFLALVGSVAGKRMVTPILLLKDAAHNLAIGNIDVPIDFRSRDELGELAEAFRGIKECQTQKTAFALAISEGDFEKSYQAASGQDHLGLAMIRMKENLIKSKAETTASMNDALQKVHYLNSVSTPVLAVDRKMNIRFINKTGAQLAGKSQANCVGQKCYDLFRNSHCQTSACRVHQAMSQDKVFTGETTVTASNLNLPIQYSGTPLKDETGQIVGGLEYIVDMTAIRQVISEVNRTAAALKAGIFTERVRVDNAEGEYGKLINSINGAVDAIMNPVNEIVTGLSRLNNGDLNFRISGNYEGDFSLMKNSFNRTVENLSELVQRLQGTANDLFNASKQVTDASTTMSEGAVRQAGFVQEISASANAITHQSQHNTDSALRVNELSVKMKNAAEKGSLQMVQMVSAISGIRDASEKVSNIIRSIDDIAFQTNLLALNAAVEAARAGVHGKGFAVVAEEVRGLAQRSARASKETTGLIEHSITQVQNGSKVADHSSGALNEIASQVSSVAQLIGEITDASQQQTMGIRQMNIGLGEIDRVTQANTASAEQTAAAAETLNATARELREMLSHFSVGEKAAQAKQEVVLW